MHPIRNSLPLLACLLLAACASQAPRNPLAHWVPSANYNARQPVVIVLHHTDQDSVQQSLDTLRSANSGGKVSSHYLVGRDGDLYQLVADDKRAWHAGPGRWGTIMRALVGLRVSEDAEREGLDISSHGESAYES